MGARGLSVGLKVPPGIGLKIVEVRFLLRGCWTKDLGLRIRMRCWVLGIWVREMLWLVWERVGSRGD